MPALNPEHRRRFKRLLKNRAQDVDDLVHQLHEEVFEETDCLTCANCCKTTSPLFIQKDIDRLATHFKMRPVEFVIEYLNIDDDGDYVFNRPAPCPFLGEDNYCSVYDARPRACREYPHTDRKNIAGIANLTIKNAEICPAVVKILERLP